MLFISYTFVFLFLPATVLIYALAGKRWGRGGAIVALGAASLIFYGYWKVAYVPLLLGSVVFNYFMGAANVRLLERGSGRGVRRLVLAVGVLGNLGLLGYFKYANFFVEALDEVTGVHWELAPIVLPLAISFFTFQQIAYIVDAYWGQTKRSDFPQYFLFLTFFPQLVAGPIIKHSDTLPQIKDRPFFRFSHENLAIGLTVFVFGYFKKVVIADHLAFYANPAFDLARDGLPVYFFEAWGSALAYTLQLYFDFSGYSDMAIGLGRIFGIRLPLNFNSPFRATSIMEIWRVWHVTLYRFLRGYLYIPLGGNRKGWWRRLINVMATMLAGGIWHGAGWTFIIFGGLHSIFMMITLAWHFLLERLGRKPDGPAWQWTARVLTVIAFTAGCMIFRADNLDAVFGMTLGMAGARGLIPPELTPNDLAVLRVANRLVFPMSGFFWSLVLLAFCWWAPNAYQVMQNHPAGLTGEPEAHWTQRFAWVRWEPKTTWVLVVLVLAAVAALMANRTTPFIYFQF